MTLSLISVTVLVVLMTCLVFTLLFENYAVSDREETLTACAEDIARLVSEDEAGTYEYHQKTISDYSLFTETALNAKVWIMDDTGLFRQTSPESETPLHLKELSSEKVDLIGKALSGDTFLTTGFSDLFDTNVLTVLVPIWSTTFFENEKQDVIGVVLVHSESKIIDETVGLARTFLLVSVAIAVVFSSIVSVILAERYTGPLKKMNRAAIKMAQGDYSIRTEVRKGGEISTLSASLDNLAATLATTIDELNGEKEKLNNIIDNVSDGLCAFDLSLQTTKSNIAFMRMCTEASLHEDGIYELMAKAMEQNRVAVKVVEKTDILKYIATPTYDEHNGSTGCLLIVQDISQSERLERSRRAFVSDVSHEFRTPLTVIRGYIELLADEAVTDPEEIKKTYARIEKETVALEKLVRDMLALSRMQSGRMELELERTDLNEILETICENMRTVSSKKQIEIVYSPVTLPDVVGNYDKLRQLFIILLDNAVKFTPENGRIFVTTSSENECVRVTVRDTGVGIPKEDLPYIFERFFKTDKSRTALEGSGSGLGLSIASSIVDLLGGEIEAQSELGKGTSFTVSLRLFKEETP